MCGRYALSVPAETLAKLFHFQQLTLDLEPRFNIAPTQLAPVARVGRGGTCELTPMRWGLVPRWAKDRSIGSRMINARSESVAEKPAFRDAFRRRRCLVPASGFYEWKKTQAGTKQPYFIHRADHQPLAMAGLWESWDEPAGRGSVETFTILTTTANDTMRALHDRMPVILSEDQFDPWLAEQELDPVTRHSLLQPAPPDLLTLHQVSRRVNSPSIDEPSLIEPETPAVQAERPAAQPPLFD